MNRADGQKGFSMVEIVIALGLVSIITIVFHNSAHSALQLYRVTEKKEQAYAHASGVLDSVTASKSSSFFSLAEGVYHQDEFGSFVSGTEEVEDFTREIQIEDLCRESSGTLLECDGIVIKDPNSKKVTVTVSWNNQGQSGSIGLTKHLNNWQQL